MKNNILRALSEKSFFNLWVGEVLTQIAANLFYFFLILIVYKQTQSNTAVSFVVICFTVPAILFGSLAGVFVDRWNKKYVLIATNILRAILLISLAFYLKNLFVIYSVAFIVAILTQFFIPAESPIIPLVVKPKNLLSANALFSLGIFGSILIAYVLSGPLIILIGSMRTLFVLAFLLVLGTVFISFIKLTYGKIEKKDLSYDGLNIVEDVKHTLQLILSTKEVSQSLFLIAMAQVLILILAAIAPGYATQVLGINVESFPILFVAPAALGMMIGAIILVNIFHSHPKEKLINVGILLSGLALLFLPYGSKVASRDFVHILNQYLPHIFDITILHIIAVLAFLLGIANSLIFVPANTLIQEKTTDEFRGKIYGFLNAIIGAIALVPILLVGGLADLIGVAWVIGGLGVCLLVFGAIRIFMK